LQVPGCTNARSVPVLPAAYGWIQGSDRDLPVILQIKSIKTAFLACSNAFIFMQTDRRIMNECLTSNWRTSGKHLENF
jgi:hypothetical protein